MRIFRHLVIWIVFGYASWSMAIGQISGVGADKATVTSYPAKDSVFVFNLPKTGSLFAKNPFGGNATFEWSRYDTASNNFKFSIFVKTDVNTTSSIAPNLAQGGYRVKIRSAGNRDTSFLAWVFLNNFTMSLLKDVNGFVKFNNRTCLLIDMFAQTDTIQFKTYIYYDTLDNSHKKLKLTNRINYVWSANPTLSYSLNTNSWHLRIDSTINGRPPTKNDITIFSVKATDRFNLTRTDSIKYKSIQTRAHFRVTWDHFPNNFNDTISAPLTVSFIDDSERANLYQWSFPGVFPDSATTMDPGTRTYLLPKAHTITLTTTSPEACVDTFKVTFNIARGYIGAGFIGKDTTGTRRDSLPNVFIAGGGQTFLVRLVSIGEFHITIFSRWGKVVYEFDGPAEGWHGWDGNIGNSKASEGLYYYLIQASTYDPNPRTDYMKANGQYKGFFYLFRND